MKLLSVCAVSCDDVLLMMMIMTVMMMLHASVPLMLSPCVKLVNCLSVSVCTRMSKIAFALRDTSESNNVYNDSNRDDHVALA